MPVISHGFDGGNIEVVDARLVEDIRLLIRSDTHSRFQQWFYFRLMHAAHSACCLRILNAAECTYHYGWLGYQALASYDRQSWFRVPTRYENGELIINFTPKSDSVFFAYFAPYSYERHLDFISKISSHPMVKLEQVGISVEGRDMDVIHVGQPKQGKPRVWILARQHPGETMAEWAAEGLLDALLDANNPIASWLREEVVISLVPNMNPDGAYHGNLRANALGVNLNREWKSPTISASPEVYWVRASMLESGVDLFLDLHGDETIPHVFVDGNQMVPGFSSEDALLEEAFKADLLQTSLDFQISEGYAPDLFSEEMLSLASKWVFHQFKTLSLTLEMPFKDHINNPDPVSGWSIERSKKLGADLLVPIYRHFYRQMKKPFEL